MFRDLVVTMIFYVVIHEVRLSKFGTLSRAEIFSTWRATDGAVCAPLRLRAMATIDPPNSSSRYVRLQVYQSHRAHTILERGVASALLGKCQGASKATFKAQNLRR